MKILNISKFVIIAGIVGLLISIIMFKFNPFYKGETEKAVGVIMGALEDEINYEFYIGDEKIHSTVLDNNSGLYSGEPVIIRYLKEDYKINTIDIYDYVFYKEMIVIGLSFFVLAIGLGIFITEVFLKKIKKL